MPTLSQSEIKHETKIVDQESNTFQPQQEFVQDTNIINGSREFFTVTFEKPHDARNPLNWTTQRKWMVTNVLSATSFNRIMVSTIMAPALSVISAELGMSPAEAAMSLSIYLLAVAFGPLFIGPLSELYGRQVVLHVSNIWFLIWNLVCGFANTKGTLVASRFLACFGASAIYALAGGVLGDIWRPEARGRSLGVYSLFPLLGAAVGPIIGGFIVGYTTWRWVFWATSLFQAIMILVSFFAFHESYAPLILKKLAAKRCRETGDNRYRVADYCLDGSKSPVVKIYEALSRPLRFLITHPTIQLASLLMGLEYGILYIVLSTFANLWTSKYHQSDEVSGLHYIAVALGELVGSQIGGALMDHLYRRKQQRSPSPESRMPLSFPMIILGWIGALLYGWTAHYRIHWVVVDVGVFIMMFGQQIAGMPVMAYIIDVYGDHRSSALAATQFVRSLTAFSFPLFAPSMYAALGYGWSNSVLAMDGLMLTIPAAALLWKFGAFLRAKIKASSG